MLFRSDQDPGCGSGFPGAAAWILVWIAALRAAFRIRKRGSQENLSRDDQILFVTGANGLIASMSAFLVGGSFVSMALNDLTWFTFALVTSLDLISRRACEAADQQRVETAAVTATALPPLTWRPVQERTQ